MQTSDGVQDNISKIACAEKLFEQLSTANVKYGKVDSFNTLMDIVK